MSNVVLVILVIFVVGIKKNWFLYFRLPLEIYF